MCTYHVFFHNWLPHCRTRKAQNLVLCCNHFMDFIYGIINLIIRDPAFDIPMVGHRCKQSRLINLKVVSFKSLCETSGLQMLPLNSVQTFAATLKP